MMPIKKDSSGRRCVEAEAEVPGTPEQVWDAIATGPGVSSWFVPTEVEQSGDGTPTRVINHFGPGSSMDAVSTVTAWDPPRRFAAESPGEGPGSPSVATEWTVEARDGGTCVVRVVHSWFASTDDWDAQFEGHEQGWVAFFRILRLYLTHFRGEPSASIQAMAMTSRPVADAWRALLTGLGLMEVMPGDRVRSAAGAPSLAGSAERAASGEYPELLLRLDTPAPGIAYAFAMSMGGMTCVPVRLYLFGAQAAATVAREQSTWQSWLDARLAGAASEV
jgi:uncharacterized protein YndB with AHSA1/START domain